MRGAAVRGQRRPDNSLHVVGDWEHHAQEPNFDYANRCLTTGCRTADEDVHGPFQTNLDHFDITPDIR